MQKPIDFVIILYFFVINFVFRTLRSNASGKDVARIPSRDRIHGDPSRTHPSNNSNNIKNNSHSTSVSGGQNNANTSKPRAESSDGMTSPKKDRPTSSSGTKLPKGPSGSNIGNSTPRIHWAGSHGTPKAGSASPKNYAKPLTQLSEALKSESQHESPKSADGTNSDTNSQSNASKLPKICRDTNSNNSTPTNADSTRFSQGMFARQTESSLERRQKRQSSKNINTSTQQFINPTNFDFQNDVPGLISMADKQYSSQARAPQSELSGGSNRSNPDTGGDRNNFVDHNNNMVMSDRNVLADRDRDARFIGGGNERFINMAGSPVGEKFVAAQVGHRLSPEIIKFQEKLKKASSQEPPTGADDFNKNIDGYNKNTATGIANNNDNTATTTAKSAASNSKESPHATAYADDPASPRNVLPLTKDPRLGRLRQGRLSGGGNIVYDESQTLPNMPFSQVQALEGKPPEARNTRNRTNLGIVVDGTQGTKTSRMTKNNHPLNPSYQLSESHKPSLEDNDSESRRKMLVHNNSAAADVDAESPENSTTSGGNIVNIADYCEPLAPIYQAMPFRPTAVTAGSNPT